MKEQDCIILRADSITEEQKRDIKRTVHNRGKRNPDTDKEGTGKQRIKQKRKTIRSLKCKERLSNVP